MDRSTRPFLDRWESTCYRWIGSSERVAVNRSMDPLDIKDVSGKQDKQKEFIDKKDRPEFM